MYSFHFNFNNAHFNIVLQSWADASGFKNDLQAWDCGRGNRTICSTECSFHVQQAKAALAAGM